MSGIGKSAQGRESIHAYAADIRFLHVRGETISGDVVFANEATFSTSVSCQANVTVAVAATLSCLGDVSVAKVCTISSLTCSGIARFTGGTMPNVTVISVVTADDDSHTLGLADCGEVWITAALANGAVIKLPAANATGAVGAYYKIIMMGTPADDAAIALPNGGTGEFVGTLRLRGGLTSINSQVETVIVTKAASDNIQKMIIDPDDASEGGAPGSIFYIYYLSTTVVQVFVDALATEQAAPVGNTFFNSTGY
jgi:hypothetical protein